MRKTTKQEAFFISSLAQTKRMGGLLAQTILQAAPKKNAFVLGLQGELGSGKTSFAQGFAKGLGIKETVLSPTFVMVKSYLVPFTERVLYHIDCYRLERAKDLLDLGWGEMVSNPQNIILVEWAERARKILPADTVWITFEGTGKNTRKISFPG